jgi:hypothetical protein
MPARHSAGGTGVTLAGMNYCLKLGATLRLAHATPLAYKQTRSMWGTDRICGTYRHEEARATRFEGCVVRGDGLPRTLRSTVKQVMLQLTNEHDRRRWSLYHRRRSCSAVPEGSAREETPLLCRSQCSELNKYKHQALARMR